jgi:hypothetical protein
MFQTILNNFSDFIFPTNPTCLVIFPDSGFGKDLYFMNWSAFPSASASSDSATFKTACETASYANLFKSHTLSSAVYVYALSLVANNFVTTFVSSYLE